MARTTKKAAAAAEETAALEAANTQTQSAPEEQPQQGGRRALSPEQLNRIRERNDRNFKRQRSEVFNYMRLNPRNGGDIRRQQRFVALSSQILSNISQLDNIAVIVGDDFTSRASNVLRNVASVTRVADEAFTYGKESDKASIIEKSKELQALKDEALKALNDLNSKVSLLGKELSKLEA